MRRFPPDLKRTLLDYSNSKVVYAFLINQYMSNLQNERYQRRTRQRLTRHAIVTSDSDDRVHLSYLPNERLEGRMDITSQYYDVSLCYVRRVRHGWQIDRTEM